MSEMEKCPNFLTINFVYNCYQKFITKFINIGGYSLHLTELPAFLHIMSF